jgi:microcystin-dependent protein
LFSVIGINHGAGDGTTTFNLPDLRGRVPVGLDNMGAGAASRITGSLPNGSTNPSTTLGGTGGEQKHQITVAELASHNHSSGTDAFVEAGGGLSAGGSGSASNWGFVGTTANTGGDTPHNNVQPSIFLNYIIRT